jgi:hypothetical protein
MCLVVRDEQPTALGGGEELHAVHPLGETEFVRRCDGMPTSAEPSRDNPGHVVVKVEVWHVC